MLYGRWLYGKILMRYEVTLARVALCECAEDSCESLERGTHHLVSELRSYISKAPTLSRCRVSGLYPKDYFERPSRQ